MEEQNHNLKTAIKELEAVFGKGFAKNNPELAVKFYQSYILGKSAELISSSLNSLAVKIEVGNIRNGGTSAIGGFGGLGMGGGMDYMGLGNMEGLDDLAGKFDEDFDLPYDFDEEGLKNKD